MPVAGAIALMNLALPDPVAKVTELAYLFRLKVGLSVLVLLNISGFFFVICHVAAVWTTIRRCARGLVLRNL